MSVKKPLLLFDESHGQRRWEQTGFQPHTLDGSFSLLAETLRSDFIIKPNTERIYDKSISGADVVVIPSPAGQLTESSKWEVCPDSLFDAEECGTLRSFVEKGGGLLLMAHRHSDPFVKSNFNAVATQFGFEFEPKVFINSSTSAMGDGWAPITTRIEQHPVTSNVYVICLPYCCPIRIMDNDACRPLVWPPANTLARNLYKQTSQADKSPAIAVSYIKEGRVVGIGSDALFSASIGSQPLHYHNMRLAQNIMTFLATSKHSDASTDFKPKVFLSHQTADKDFVRKLAEDLIGKGIDVWFDEFNLLVGDSLTESIDRAISDSDFFVLVISKKALESKWVSKEYQAANARMLAGSGLCILPAVIEDCDPPSFLRDTVWADFRQNYERAFERLIRSIETHFSRKPR